MGSCISGVQSGMHQRDELKPVSVSVDQLVNPWPTGLGQSLGEGRSWVGGESKLGVNPPGKSLQLPKVPFSPEKHVRVKGMSRVQWTWCLPEFGSLSASLTVASFHEPGFLELFLQVLQERPADVQLSLAKWAFRF